MLAEQQAAFMAHVLDEDAALPAGWTTRHAAGMAIYRNNYRTALVEALRATYERTARWVGEASFARAAAHHVIAHPPTSWTLDLAGAGLPETLAQLFGSDPEVAELAALEWAMHRAFAAGDAAPIDGAGFAAATAGFTPEDWAGLQLQFVPGCAALSANHDLAALWTTLGEEAFDAPVYHLPQPVSLIVWREGLSPVFRQAEAAEGAAMALALGGARYDDLCGSLVEWLGEEQGIARAGEWLGQWLRDGLIAGIRR